MKNRKKDIVDSIHEEMRKDLPAFAAALEEHRNVTEVDSLLLDYEEECAAGKLDELTVTILHSRMCYTLDMLEAPEEDEEEC